jgi:fructokinase
VTVSTDGVIVIVGEALVDLVVAVDGTITATPGGAPFNVARACARLGAPVALVAAVSTDRFGERLQAQLVADGVGTELLQRTALPTTLAVAELDTSGSAIYQFYVAGTSTSALSVAVLPPTTTAVVAGGLGLTIEPMATAVERSVVDAGDDALVLVDINCRPGAVGDREAYVARLRRVLARADVVKASVEDLAFVDPTGDPPTTAAQLLGWGPRVLLLTAGAAATTVVTAGGLRSVPVEASPILDTIGAGDSFTAGFLTWWTTSGRSRDDLADADAVMPAVRAAHDVAAVVVGRRGADSPRRRDLPPGWGPR